jgi:hypothetical protein
VPSGQTVYLKFGVTSARSKESPTDPIAQGRNVFRAGLLDQPVGIDCIDFDKLSDSDWSTSENARMNGLGLSKCGPYQLRLPTGICTIEVTSIGELRLLLNSTSQVRLSFSPMRSSGSWYMTYPPQSNSAQRDYPLDSALPRLAWTYWDEGYQSALWLSTLDSDFESFPPGVDP